MQILIGVNNSFQKYYQTEINGETKKRFYQTRLSLVKKPLVQLFK